jgi:N-acetylmuramic acid 6-phosphate etherase
MTRLGRVYGGLMVDMRANTAKLRRRGVRMVMTITGCDEGAATKALTEGAGSIKLAALIARGSDGKSAQALLDKHGGNLRQAIMEIERR